MCPDHSPDNSSKQTNKNNTAIFTIIVVNGRCLKEAPSLGSCIITAFNSHSITLFIKPFIPQESQGIKEVTRQAFPTRHLAWLLWYVPTLAHPWHTDTDLAERLWQHITVGLAGGPPLKLYRFLLKAALCFLEIYIAIRISIDTGINNQISSFSLYIMVLGCEDNFIQSRLTPASGQGLTGCL